VKGSCLGIGTLDIPNYAAVAAEMRAFADLGRNERSRSDTDLFNPAM
jgi:hypothetical protein